VEKSQDVAAARVLALAAAAAAVVGGADIRVVAPPLVAFGWATLFVLAVFGSFQGAGGRMSSCPRNPRPSSDLGGRTLRGGWMLRRRGRWRRRRRRQSCGSRKLVMALRRSSLVAFFCWAPSMIFSAQAVSRSWLAGTEVIYDRFRDQDASRRGGQRGGGGGERRDGQSAHVEHAKRPLEL